MRLAWPLVWGLSTLYAACFVGFIAAALLAYSGIGYAHEYTLLGLGLPEVLGSLLLLMAVSAELLWAHYRRDSYTTFEETFWGALLGLSVFGLILVTPLVPMA